MVDLKSILSGKNTNIEYYWALVLEPGWVQAGIWCISESKAQIVSLSPPSAWTTDNELVGACDTALSSSVQNLPEDAGEPAKTVFGVTASWVDQGQIKKDHLDKIKRICSELSLEPVGFVVLPEAISHYIKSEEGSPLNAVVIGISNENLELSIFRLGNLVGNAIVARSVSFYDDVVEGLTRFAANEAFPSRFILYNGKEGELEEARQVLTDAPWDEAGKVKFLHTPKIEIITPDKKVLATALAGGSEIAQVTNVLWTNEEGDEKEEGEGIKAEEENGDTTLRPEDFGFSVGEDVAQKSDNLVKPTPDDEQASKSLQEVLERKEIPGQEVASQPQVETGTDAKLHQPEVVEDKKSFFTSLGNIKSKVISPFTHHEREKSAFPSHNGSRYNSRIFILGVIIFILLFFGGGAFWWFYPKATVTVYVSPKDIEESISILIDPDSDNLNFEDKIIPGELKEEEVSGDKTKSTTGTKTVGEKAKGEVVLYRSGIQIDLGQGTVLFGPGGLEYTLDDDVTVASGSAGNPGKTQAQVTASDIGAQYNLASGETFNIDEYSTSDVEGKNESAFSGGSSREISAVSQDDQKQLESELTDELLDKAKNQIESSISSDDYYIQESAESEVKSKEFSDKVGDEAGNLKLSLNIKVSALVIKKSNLSDFSREVLKDKVASGFVLREDQIVLSFDYRGEKDGMYEVKANIKANLLPQVNPDEIASKIYGKYPDVAEEYLSSIDGFTRAEITLKPRLPGKLGTLPRVKKNITVEVAAQK